MLGIRQLVLWTLCAVWVTVHTITVETSQGPLKATRGKSVTLPCTYRTSAPDRNGLIQWDKLLRSHSERVLTWTFSPQTSVYGSLYENRVNISSHVEQSDASITIAQLTMEDNGTYECSVSLMSDLDGVSKARVPLLVLVSPSVPDCRINGETVIGNDIQLTCQSAEGSPAPQYSWKSFDAQNQERPLVPPVSGQTLLLKNLTTAMSGYYTCTSSNEVGTESCDITVSVRPPSMNVALYAGIAGGVVAALIIIGIIVYCCCFREKEEKTEVKDAERRNQIAYQQPSEQMRELSRKRDEEDDYRHEDQRSSGHESPDPEQ